MPYPAQIDRSTAIDTACALIEAEGIESLSLARLAAQLGIKAPSLYHHFSSKAELLQGVSLRTSEALVEAVHHGIAGAGSDPKTRLRGMAHVYRDFAHSHPLTLMLAFGAASPDARPDPAALEALAIPLQEALIGLAGEANSLSALRGVWALIHGFVMLELNGQFQRGGDLDQVLDYAVDAYAAGCAQLNR